MGWMMQQVNRRQTHTTPGPEAPMRRSLLLVILVTLLYAYWVREPFDK